MNRHLIILALAFCVCTLQAQNDSLRRTTTSYQLGVGGSHVLDTYLSQEKFSGLAFTLLITTERERPASSWTTLMEHQLNLSTLNDRTNTQSELQGDYSFYYGRLYRWQFAHEWKLQAGGMLNANAGFIYNTGNSNNPAQARLSAMLMPTATVSKDFRLFDRHLRLRYEVQLPLVGIMFSPNYGQSYYEIFNRGNYDHNAVPTTFVSAPSFRQQLTLHYSLTPLTTLTLGYLGDYQQANVNNLKSHIYAHRFMIGFIRQFSIIPHRL